MLRRLQVGGGVTPRGVLCGWPADRPLAALWSAGVGPSRWSVLAQPRETIRVPGGASAAELRAALDRVCAVAARGVAGAEGPPFAGGWIGWISYDAGRVIEPRAGSRGPEGRAGPHAWLAEFHRCPDALVYDHASREWWGVGEFGESQISDATASERAASFEAGEMRSRTGREAYIAAAARVVEYIRAGDIYQANLAHRLSGAFRGSARSLFAELAAGAKPWYGAYLESTIEGTRHALASASPEEFVSYDAATREVRTRPMKGTGRPGAAGHLAASEKERAELNMIVDLMRNDLGRVCEFGSVRVGDGRTIETHAGGGLLQATATVRGRVRAGLGLADVLWAALPGGSVTGAPKIRAMQIIDELEPLPRGPYCGCIGYVSNTGHAAFNIAIRTAVIQGAAAGPGLDEIDGELSYSVGAGIVADSDPEAEWLETLDKAGVLRAVARVEHTDGVHSAGR